MVIIKFLVIDGVITDVSTMSRDITGFNALGFGICTFATGPLGYILTSRGTTG